MEKDTKSDLEIDFENYKIEDEKRDQIRSHIDELKESGLAKQFQNLVAEFGEEIKDDLGLEPNSSKQSKKNQAKFVEREDEELGLVRAELEIHDLRVKVGAGSFFELSFLPKSDEILLKFLDPEFASKKEKVMALFSEDFEKASNAKKERKEAWSKRFKKKTGSSGSKK